METKEYVRLLDVIEKLRDPISGCPWDLEQTHESLLKYLVEESYEFIHAVEQKNFSMMEDELGDVLLQVLLHSIIAKEKNHFDMEKVCKGLADKMIRRHPHIFENPGQKLEVEEVLDNWGKIKEKEKEGLKKEETEISHRYLNYPSLISAYKIGKKTNELKFDWDGPGQVSYKVEEEWQELKEELAPETKNQNRIKEELGDFLFSVVQLSRHLKIDPEEALREANVKFLTRFQKMENLIKKDNQNLNNMNQMEMDVYWNQAKVILKGSSTHELK